MFDAVRGDYQGLEVRLIQRDEVQDVVNEMKLHPFIEIPLKKEEGRIGECN